MNLSLWRDISIIWLSILCMIGLLIPVVVTYLGVIAMHRVLTWTPDLLGRTQRLSATVRSKTIDASQRVAEPVITAESRLARAAMVWRKIWGMQSSKADAAGKDITYAD